VSLIVPRPTFLRVLDALRWSRLVRSSLMLGTAFAAGALCAGILAKPPAGVPAVPTPIAMAAIAAAPKNFVPVRSRKAAATKPARKVAEEAGAKRETVGLAAVEAAAPSATGATPQAAAAVAGEARAQERVQDLTSASTSGEAPRVASDSEQSANGPPTQDAEAALKATKEARHAKRLAKRNHWRMVRAQLGANGSQWAYAWANENQLTVRPRYVRRGAAMADDRAAGPALFLFGRFDNRNM
jgi:hypothetical protein